MAPVYLVLRFPSHPFSQPILRRRRKQEQLLLLHTLGSSGAVVMCQRLSQSSLASGTSVTGIMPSSAQMTRAKIDSELNPKTYNLNPKTYALNPNPKP